MSWSDFNKIPVEDLVTGKPDETLNSSTQSNSHCSYLFGKTAGEAAFETNVKKHCIVDYSTTSDEMFQIDKGMVTGTGSQND